jgi:hypothetical protein
VSRDAHFIIDGQQPIKELPTRRLSSPHKSCKMCHLRSLSRLPLIITGVVEARKCAHIRSQHHISHKGIRSLYLQHPKGRNPPKLGWKWGKEYRFSHNRNLWFTVRTEETRQFKRHRVTRSRAAARSLSLELDIGLQVTSAPRQNAPGGVGVCRGKVPVQK